jgi:ABC-type phosphate transport system permease subunit
VSWFYAAMLGVGRPLAWKYSLVELLAAYPVLIVGGFGAMVLLTAWAKNKDAQGRMQQGTWDTRNAALAGW